MLNNMSQCTCSTTADDQPKEYKHLKRKKRHKNDIKASKQHSLLKILEKSESVSVK